MSSSRFPFPVMRGTGFVRGPVNKAAGSRLSAHLKYLEHRTLGEEETRETRRIFSNDEEQVSRKDAVHDVMEHTSSAVNYHKIVLSPAEYEHIDDFRQWTREVMHDLEEHKGIALHWYAVVHANEREHISTPHIHVVLAGAGEDTQTGATRTVGMYQQDYAFLRAQGREHGNFELYQELERTLHELDRHDLTTKQQTLDLERNPFEHDELSR